MKIESDFHMAQGEGETSYSNNSRLQQKTLLETEPLLAKSMREVYMVHHPAAMTVADLGCSSGDNTLLFVSKVVEAMAGSHHGKLMELQFFLNDLPRNDFNQIFRSVERFKEEESTAVERKGGMMPPFYVAGLPGSYYTRLFPYQTVHLFHSSYCLHWRSKLPDGLEGASAYLNEGNIYIAKTSPPSVVKLYQGQFQKDMLLFLKLRCKELVFGGHIVLTFLGRKNEDVYNGDMNHLCGLLARSVQSLVEEGLVQKEMLHSFNLPVYTPSMDEVKAVVSQIKLLDITCIKLFQSNWDPYDDSDGDNIQNSIQSGINVAKSMRAVMGPLFASHFGESVVDEIFKRHASNVAEHLEREKTKYSVIVLSLKRRS